MRELKPIDGWVSKEQKYKGRYRDENGNGLCGTWLREYKNSYEAVILSNGNSLGQYKYPKIDKLPFKSKMHSWQNLYLCGGYSLIDRDGIGRMDEDQSIVDAVCAGLKPIGFVVTYSEEEIEKYKRQVELAGLPYDVICEHLGEEVVVHDYGYRYTSSQLFRMGIANHGTIGEVFDLTNYVESYKQMAQEIGYKGIEKDLEYVLDRASLKLSDFIPNYGVVNGYKHYDPQDVSELMFTGLILGYPIESTFNRAFYW